MRNIRLEVLRRVTAFLLVFFIAGSGFGLSGCSSKKDNQAGTVGVLRFRVRLLQMIWHL